MPSFDVISKLDAHELDNAVSQTKKELATRYDFQNTKTEVDFTPTWVERSSYTVTLATPQSNPVSYDRTVAAVTSLGPLAYDGEPRFTPITRAVP